jgi:hypothetical protein
MWTVPKVVDTLGSSEEYKQMYKTILSKEKEKEKEKEKVLEKESGVTWIKDLGTERKELDDFLSGVLKGEKNKYQNKGEKKNSIELKDLAIDSFSFS